MTNKDPKKMRSINTIHPPVYRDAGFYLKDAETTKKAFAEELEHPRSPDTYIYSRYRNPTVVAAEESIMALEKCSWAILTQSGMAAIDVALSIFQRGEKSGKWLFFSEIYGGTNSFIDKILIEKRGLDIHRFYASEGAYDMDLLEERLNQLRPELVYLEVISNPMLIVADAVKIINLAKKVSSRVIIDNTFTTPYLWNPLDHGADLVIHSATKYLSGHGNLTAGVLCGNDPQMEKRAVEYRKLVGHMLSPDDAYRLITMLKSFEVRFSRHCENAYNLANVLNNHPAVESVLYPGLAGHPSHFLAKKLFQEKGYGAMITFDLAGLTSSEKERNRDMFIELVSDKIRLIPSLGDAETILLPVEAVWGDKYPLPGMIRFSVGIEKFNDLEQVVTGALDKLGP
jgi:cystathionine beta-lyase/cystathionine gamma-synthase